MRRLLAVGALVLALALPLAGCTGAPVPAAPAPVSGDARVVSDAVAATLAAGSARVTADLRSPVGPVSASGPVRFDPFAADLSGTAEGRSVAVRSVDGSTWVNLGDRWRSVSSGLVPVGAVPAAVRAASGLRDVTVAGPDTVDGAPTTRYRGIADLDAAASAAASASSDPNGIRQLSGLVGPRPSVEVWVGADGRVAQLRFAPATPGEITVRLADPGIPVEVERPTA